MINNPKETDFPPREEGNSSEIGKVTPKASSSASSANPVPWLRLKDPRIVRMSRVFGGKDRHSKVCTVRGLKDRRVRLSVPTAIQLYDLQDRLGLNQPSKVVDWLLNAAKHDIDELPPLPIPLAGNFSLLTPREADVAAAAAATASQSNNEDQGVVLRNNNDNEMNAIEWELGSRSRPNFWTSTTTTRTTSSDALWRARSKEVTRDNNERENWRGNTATATTNEVEKGGGNEGSNNILPQRTNNHPFFPGMLNNIAHVPNIANYRWELPNYPLLSHLGGNHGFNVTSQTDHIQHLQSLNVMSLQPSTLSLSTGSPFMLCPPGIASTSTTTQTYFPSQSSAANSVEIVDPRQVNHHFQMLSSNAAAQNLLPNPMMRPLHFGMNNSKQLVGFSPNDNIGSDQQQNKEQE